MKWRTPMLVAVLAALIAGGASAQETDSTQTGQALQPPAMGGGMDPAAMMAMCQQMMGPGMMGQGMMGQGMMGPGMMMGPGIGPGMMGMAPGMGGWGPWMIAPGAGPGMGWGMGSGMGLGMGMGPGGGMMMGPGRPLARDLTTADVTHMLEHHLAWHGNPRLKLGEVKEVDADTITADVVTQDGSLVQRLEVDRHTGMMRPAA